MITKFLFLLIASISMMIVCSLPTDVFAVRLSLSPVSGLFNTGDIITAQILLNMEGENTAGVDTYLTFNPRVLYVLDENPLHTGTQIKAGSLMPNTPLNIVDNSIGQIRFSQITVGAMTPFSNNTPQEFASIRFKAIGGGNGLLEFTFIPKDTHDTNVAFEGEDILTGVSNATYNVSGGTLHITPGASLIVIAGPLNPGVFHPDVLNLQKLLNRLGFVVASSGLGSPGNETTFYGNATRMALSRFQDKYMPDMAPEDKGILTAATVDKLFEFAGEGKSLFLEDNIPEIYLFTRPLSLGSKGEDVRQLQMFLNSIGYPIASSGDGSRGYETVYFGGRTETALKKYQCDKKIVCQGSAGSTGWGVVGPKTRYMLHPEQQSAQFLQFKIETLQKKVIELQQKLQTAQ